MANRTISSPPSVPSFRALPRASNSPQSTKSIKFEVLSLALFAFSIFTLAALITFDPKDPSLFSRVSHPETIAIANACGKIGAWIAAFFLQIFGLGGFLLPFSFLFAGVTVFEKSGWVRVLGILSGMGMAAIAVTVFLALQWPRVGYAGTSLLTGGIIGAWISDFLLQSLNHLGASIVSLFVFSVALVLSTPIRLARMIGLTTQFLAQLMWQATKLLGAYLFYLLGLAAARTAHATGDLLQSGVEKAMERMKEIRAKKAEERPVMDVVSEVIEAESAPIETTVDKSSGPEVEPLVHSQPPYEAPCEAPYEAIEIRPSEPVLQASSTPVSDSTGPEIVPFEVIKPKDEEPKAKRPVKAGPWKLPLYDFLRKVPKTSASFDRSLLFENSEILTKKLADFGIVGEVTQVRPGPVITLYEFKPGPGIKVSKIAALADDLSMALSAKSVRILAPLPGKAVVGIEIPSAQREKVFLREFLQDPDFFGDRYSIPVVMGKDISGQAIFSDLAKMPHLLCAGQTGSGKSVFMNALICSLLYRFNPDELRMILVDPKFIEFRAFQDIPHLLLPVVDEPKEAAIALKWAVREMQRRYRILAKIGAKNLAQYNQKVVEMGLDVVRDLLLSESEIDQTPSKAEGSDWLQAFEPDENGEPQIGKLPYIVIIIDELADLVMIAKKEVEISINRIAQKARAAGIHLIVATQRPSTDVVTGLIKVNLPSRVSFHLASYVDSKTILDRSGAEFLLGEGDMLFTPPGGAQLVRLQGAYVEDDEIHKITSFLKSQGKPHYREEILVDDEESGQDDEGEELDVLYHEAVDLVRKSAQASASYLQRHLGVGYNRAAKMIECMESRGVVGPTQGSKPREVL